MRRILTALLAAVSLTYSAAAQRQLDPDRYIYPVLNVAGYCSANFGEMRPNHFHSGVDIKTDGVEGKQIAATADGYIARIVVSPSGYGQALYIVHPEGTMSVYGHLSKFRPDLDSLVADRRYRSKRNSIDIWLPEGKYPVSQGDIIGLSGNTGNSFGPHLHFEIRDMRDNSTLNLIRQGIIPVRDTIPPRIEALWYIAVDTVSSVPVYARPRRIEVRRTAPGRYETAEPVKVARRGYFIAEVTDRKNSVTNRFGIYRITEKLDNRPVIEYRADGFRIEDSRWCNSVSYYPMQVDASCEVIRLARQENCPRSFYTQELDRGLIPLEDDAEHRISIEVEDDCRNISTVAFDIVPGAAEPPVTDIPDSLAIDCRRDFRAHYGDITVEFPAGALYESAFFECRQTDAPHTSQAGIVTPVYRILDASTPLQKAATVTIKAFVPADLRRHIAAAVISPKGRLSYAGGKYANGRLTVQTRSLGDICAVVDTVAPVIRPRFEPGADMRRQKALTFTVSDNFSGIKEYSAAIDGAWVPVDWSPVQGTFTIKFDHRNYPYDSQHTVTVKATDNCSNTAVWSGTVFR